MADSAADKTHPATPRRRQQARADGRVAHSPDLGSAIMLLGSLGVLLVAGGALVEFLAAFLSSCLRGDAWQNGVDAGAGHELLLDPWSALLPALTRLLLPLLGGATLLAVGVHLLQTGFLFRPAQVLPDAARINPLAGWSRVVSSASLGRIGFGLFKVVIVTAVALASLWTRRQELLALSALDLPTLASQLGEVCLWTCLQMGGALAALAVIDYGFQRYRLERELQMTPQEMREEMRELQGDPQVGARRRELSHRIAKDPAAEPKPGPAARRASGGGSPVHVGAVDPIR